MVEITLDARPKWMRRLTQHPLHKQPILFIHCLYLASMDWVLFPPKCRDSLRTFLEEL